MKQKEFINWLEALKEDLGEGYFIASINSITCYFYYSYKNNKIDILFNSNSLSVQELKFQLEKSGREITRLNNSENDMILDKYNSYLERSIDVYFNYSEGYYKVKQHQLEFVADWALSNQNASIFPYFNQQKISDSKKYVYDSSKIEKSKRKSIKLN